MKEEYKFMENYIKKALQVESKFKNTFRTTESFIFQYTDLYDYGLNIEGVKPLRSKDWFEVMNELTEEFEDILESIADYLECDEESAYTALVEVLIS